MESLKSRIWVLSRRVNKSLFLRKRCENVIFISTTHIRNGHAIKYYKRSSIPSRWFFFTSTCVCVNFYANAWRCQQHLPLIFCEIASCPPITRAPPPPPRCPRARQHDWNKSNPSHIFKIPYVLISVVCGNGIFPLEFEHTHLVSGTFCILNEARCSHHNTLVWC